MATLSSVLAEMMVLVGDLLALVAAGAGLLALFGEQRSWQPHTLRQIWSNGIVAAVLILVGLAAKLASEEMAGMVNGYPFGFENRLVAGLLLVGMVAMGAAYLARKRRQEG